MNMSPRPSPSPAAPQAAVAAPPVGGRGRRARERALRRAEVLASARQLFAKKGFQRTTMLQIAAASELALGTLYQVFASKEAILASLLEDYVDALIGRGRRVLAEPGGARTRLERVVRTQMEFSRENVDVLRFYLHGWTGYEFSVRQRFGDRIDTKYEEYLDLLAGVVRDGTRQGEFAAVPPRRLAIALAGMIHGLIRRWLREKTLDLLAEGDAMVEIVVDGIARHGKNGGPRPRGGR